MSPLGRAVLLFIVAMVALAHAPRVGGQGSATTNVPVSVHKLPLDPSLSYSTYLSGLTTSVPVAAWDNTGNACIVFDTTLIKLRNDGSLAYSNNNSLGTQPGDTAKAVAIDSQGSCYVAGTGPITPTAGVLQTSAPSQEFIIKFDVSGAVKYATYLGGSGSDLPISLAIDAFGNAYLTGSTNSNDFPTAHAFQPSFGGGDYDAFIAVLNANGSALVYSTYLGGSNHDEARSVGVDSTGNAVVAGNSNSADFPTRAALPSSLAGAGAFAAKLDPTGNVVYSTFLGGGDALGAAVDSSGNAYLTGIAGPGFPLVNPLQTTPNGAFITKINPSGSALIYSTYLGVDTYGNAIAVDSAGQTYIAGLILWGSRPSPSLPLVSPIQGSYATDGGFVSILDASGSSLLFSTFLGGGTSLNDASSLGVDSVGNIYVAGESDGGFPILNAVNGTFEPFPPCFNCATGQPIAFKIAPVSGPVLASPATVDFQRKPTPVGAPSQTVSALVANAASSGTITISGITVTGDYSQTNNCPQALLAATNCVLNMTFTPTGGGTRTGTITIADDAPGNPHVINLIGIGLVPQVSFTPTTLSFPSQVIATTSSPQTITLTNAGGAPLTITQVSVSGDFAETNDCGTSLGQSSSCQVSVTFTPTVAGGRSGTLTFVDNASGSPHTVSLSGTGVNPTVGLAIPSGGSATVSAGQSTSYTLSIGGAGVSGTALLTCTGAPRGATCLVPASQSISSTSASTFNVTVTTTSRTLAALYSPASRQSTWWWALALLGIVVMRGRGKSGRSPLRYALLVILLLLCSCGGGGGPQPNPNGTPAGNYTLTVTATVGSVTQSLTLGLIVQ